MQSSPALRAASPTRGEAKPPPSPLVGEGLGERGVASGNYVNSNQLSAVALCRDKACAFSDRLPRDIH